MDNITPEHILVGVMLLDADARATAFSRGINPEVIYDHALSAIVQQVMQMEEAGFPVELATVHRGLHGRGEEISADDLNDLMNLAIQRGNPGSAGIYADMVLEDHKGRVIWGEVQELVERLRFDPDDEQTQYALAHAFRNMQSTHREVKRGGWYADLIPAYLNDVQAMWTGRQPPCISTGFAGIDRLQRGGLYRGELTIVGGRPGSGKSVMGMALTQNVARQGKRVVFFSAEMTVRAMLRRAAAEYTQIATPLIDKPGPLQDERNEYLRRQYVAQVQDELTRLPVYIDDTSRPTIAYMRDTVERLGSIDLVVFDYLSLAGETSRNDNEVARMSAVSLGLQRLAKDLDIPVVALAQLNRSVEGDGNKRTEYRPTLSHIRDSGQIEANAHNVWLLYRRLYYVQQGMLDPVYDEQDNMDVYVAKSRESETGVARLRFDGPTFSLRDKE